MSVTDVDRGIPVLGRIRTADGRAGILVYRGGKPQHELADMDGDGLYESRYLFSADAKPSAAAAGAAPYRFEADFDLDGVFEYTENLAPPFERTWDYDGDGRVDARATALGDGGELREFLPALRRPAGYRGPGAGRADPPGDPSGAWRYPWFRTRGDAFCG
ncbi:MAG: hypothetical protein M0C28_22020 [Candidatus Moduliflexus flocculans]|nr:hypothetical protein [Candidatus Moduliflexus flocculans]